VTNPDEYTDDYLLPGLSDSEVDVVGLAGELEHFYDLLHWLSLDQGRFRYGLAVLLELYRDELSGYWTRQELNRRLGWLNDQARERLLGNLRHGWLQYEEGAYSLTARARALLSILSAVAKQMSEEDVWEVGLRAASLGRDIGVSREMARQSFNHSVNELVRDRHELQQALESKSLPRLRAAVDKSEKHYQDVNRLLEAQKELDALMGDYDVRRGHQVHDLISTVHSLVVRAKSVIRAIYDSQLQTTAQLISVQDVEEFLLQAEPDELLAMADGALSSPVHKQFLDTHDLLRLAFEHLDRPERPAGETLTPERVTTPVNRLSPDMSDPLDDLTAEVRTLLEASAELPWSAVVASDSWELSVYRIALLLQLWYLGWSETSSREPAFDLAFGDSVVPVNEEAVAKLSNTQVVRPDESTTNPNTRREFSEESRTVRTPD